MEQIITAIGNPILNEKLKLEENIKVIGNDIQYQEGIFEILEKEKNISFLVLSEMIQGELSIEKVIEKIKQINKKIKIIIILENKKEELENILIAKGVFKILYNNEIKISDLIKIIYKIENRSTENEELKQEINDLKKLIMENQQGDNKLETKEMMEHKKGKTKLEKVKNKLFSEIKIVGTDSFKKEKNILDQKEIISISGPSGVGKSIISVNLAKAISYKKNKVLMIDFDILNSSLHTILGVKKYPPTINFHENITSKLNIENFIIKINKKIDLISATKLLFETNEKIDFIKIENILNKLKERYNTIIIDTSSECFFDFTKTIIKLSNKNIFVTETNILEIKKAKELLNIYINEWKINKNKFNILFNKYDNDCVNINLLKELFCEFNIIGVLKYHSKYNKLINKNVKNNFNDKKIRNEYLKLNIK